MLTLLSFNINAQTPQGFNYQATVRNSEGTLITNANVYFKFNVLQGSQTAVPVFTEIHYIATDDLGQVNLIIGEGTATEGTFSQIDWSLGSYFLGVELNITGQSYVAMGTTQLLSVPYALYAANSGNATPSTTLGSVLSANNSADQQQIKNLLDPTDGADAVTKSYADALSKSSGLMNYNGWDNYQVWNDNTTVQLEPNSFTYVNANQTTLVFPEAANNCCVGSVIYVYVMQGDNSTPLDFVLQPSGTSIAIHTGVDLVSTATEQFQGQFQTGGLQTIVNVGDYWMVGNFKATETITVIDNNPIDNPFIGEWSGVYDETIDEDGINSGTWLGTITNQNNFIGDYVSSESNEIDTYSGFVSPNGDASLTAGTTTDGAIFTGVMYGNEASGVFVNNTSTPADYGTWKGTKTIPDNDYTFNEFVGTWRLISESEDGTDLYLNDCQLKSTIVVSPTLLLINEFSDNSFCGFNSCSIYSLETWDITYESGSTFVLINQTRDINFCNGEVDDTDTSLQLTVNFQIIGNRLEVSYDLLSSDGSTSFIQKEYVRI